MWWNILFWATFVIVAWLGLRHLMTIFLGLSQTSPLKPGQRLCHAIALLIYWGSCWFAILDHSWWPLVIAIIGVFLFQFVVIRSGGRYYRSEQEMLMAVRTENMDALKVFIEAGADINWTDSQVAGVTALHEAARQENLEIVKFLLQKGANVNAKNHVGFTPLHIATYCGNNAIVNALVEKGADINEKAKEDITPLHVAASRGYQEIVELLIGNGAEIHAKNSKSGLTPQGLAAQEGHEAVAEFLSKL